MAELVITQICIASAILLTGIIQIIVMVKINKIKDKHIK